MAKAPCEKCRAASDGNDKGFCRSHTRLGPPDAQGWRVDSGGYRVRWVTIDGKRVKQREHRVVMERLLGRPLLSSENVHHKNGNRADNNPANLELWVTAQPTGQRPEDLVQFAHEILARYGHLTPSGRRIGGVI